MLFYKLLPMLKIVIAKILFITAIGCSQADKTIKNIEHIDIQYNKIFFDTVFLSPTVYSGEGSLSISKKFIYLFDPLIGVIHTFNIDGTLEGRHLGFGGGPMELDRGHFHFVLPNGSHGFLSDYGYWLHKTNYEKERFSQIDWGCKESDITKLDRTPEPENPCLYFFKWGLSLEKSKVTVIDSQRVLVPVSFEHEKMNAFQHLDYYKRTYLFSIHNLTNGTVEKLIVKRQPNLVSRKLIPNFDLAFATVDANRDIIVTHATESLMEVWDTSGNIKMTFGIEGKNIRKDYVARDPGNYEEIESEAEEERLKFGWYNGLHFDQKSGYLFRTYYKGDLESKMKWGLQIYDTSYALIGDISLPAELKVIGSINGNFVGFPALLSEDQQPYFVKFRLSQ